MNDPVSVRLCQVDYSDPEQVGALIALLDAYARDPAGGGQPLTDFVKTGLPAALLARPFMFSVLAFDDTQNSLPVGLVNCVEGFSTFACKPLVNVHDVAVAASYRGRRIGERMLALAEDIARSRGACKMTLEVLTGNAGAMRLYERFGFSSYQLDPAFGNATFQQKWLS